MEAGEVDPSRNASDPKKIKDMWIYVRETVDQSAIMSGSISFGLVFKDPGQVLISRGSLKETSDCGVTEKGKRNGKKLSINFSSRHYMKL